MKISNLYQNVLIKNNHIITKITDNSQDVIQGSIFVAIKGTTHDGINYIDEAIRKGALTIITSSNYQSVNDNINVIKVENPKKELAIILKKRYHKKLNNFKIIAITGTNGKTTCCNLLYKYLLSLNYNVICFSSNGNYVGNKFFPTTNTTPHILTIYNTILNSHYSKGFIIIEVSSQAICEMRIAEISFDVLAYTNITQDHLDYHENITDYFYSKALLMYQLKNKGAVLINKDINNYDKLVRLSPVKTYNFGQNKECNFCYEIVESTINNTLFFINTKNNLNAFETTLIGDFNVQNITIIYGILTILQISLNNFSDFVKNIQRINGRMNVYQIYNRTFIIDYAHTANAVEASLKAINSFNHHNIKLIIGCGGNRDRLKRPIIGKLACQFSNFVYFTEDNSRNESTEKIIKEITCDLTSNNYTIIESRMEAIRKAIKDSKSNDTIVLMGKGYEKTKVLDQEYTDLEMILKILKEEKYV